MEVRLIAADLDGTLLRNDKTVSPRTLAALEAAERAGIRVVPVTGRQPKELAPVLAGPGLTGLAIASNGAIGFDLGTDEVLYETSIATDVLAGLAAAITAHRPGARIAVLRDGGREFVQQSGYASMVRRGEYRRDPWTVPVRPLDELVGTEAVKLIVRHPSLSPEHMLAFFESLDLVGYNATLSGAPFVEVMGHGVHKGSGLARLCERLGVAAREVVAFGDQLNDVEMLTWAGHGVAMGNASPPVKAAADEVTLSNEEDGLAVVIERLLDAGGSLDPR